MGDVVKIGRALLSVYNKDGIKEICDVLALNGVEMISTGGTEAYIKELGYECTPVEQLTNYPSILGGRVKTLHPSVFGGILARRDNRGDQEQCQGFGIGQIDLVVVDLYPFQETVLMGQGEEEVIEKIDIGGVSLIRAAAKNYEDVVVVASREEYATLLDLLGRQSATTTLEQRRAFARKAFEHTSKYDATIAEYFGAKERFELGEYHPLRYGENPHQKAGYYGDAFSERFEYLNGKALSYNNMLDVDAAVALIAEFTSPTAAIIKHNTPCGLAERETILEAYKVALSCDPTSAFGGIVVLNREVDTALAEELHQLFIEVLIAPAFSKEALNILTQKRNRIILVDHNNGATTGGGNKKAAPVKQYRSALGVLLEQDPDISTEGLETLKVVTLKAPNEREKEDMLFGVKAVKSCKSNAIVLVRDKQILGAGYGQTSRVDALKQAIEKAGSFGFDLNGAVMASDAFFPFGDCIEIAHKVGITAVVQPGGSLRDEESIVCCDKYGVSMVFTGVRHFRH